MQRLPEYVLATFAILRKPICTQRTEYILDLKSLEFKGRWMPFNIDFHPTLNFLVGKVGDCDIGPSAAPRLLRTSASNPCFFYEYQRVDAKLHELSLEKTSDIRRSCSGMHSIILMSINLLYAYRTDLLGHRYTSIDAENQYPLPASCRSIFSVRQEVVYSL